MGEAGGPPICSGVGTVRGRSILLNLVLVAPPKIRSQGLYR